MHDGLLMVNDPGQSGIDPPLGRRQRKAMAVRQALFDAGLTAFERQPIALVSVLDITERADVAKGVFYLQFRSKDDYLLALWEHTQRLFLDMARERVGERRSQPVRLEASVSALFEFARHSSAASRFWLRMAGFFPDEIGEPGHLLRLRSAYLRELGAVLRGIPPDELAPQDLEFARLVDAMGWAAISTEVQQGRPLVSPQQLVKMIRAASVPAR